MIVIVEAALTAVSLVLALPVRVLLPQVLASAVPRPTAKNLWGLRPKLAVLIPAHNEQFAIGKTLASVCRQLVSGDRLVVVADNCTDQTAAVARRQGAEVTVRSDSFHRGKGYALDH